MNRTVFGRHIYAIGGNRHAAELSGIKTRRVDFWLFVNMGTLAALAGLIFTARLNLAGPKAGDGFELEAISAAFIGGAAVQGGVGTIGGAIIGGLIIGVLNNGMSILGIGIEWQQAVKGLVLLLAVAFDVYNRRRPATDTCPAERMPRLPFADEGRMLRHPPFALRVAIAFQHAPPSRCPASLALRSPSLAPEPADDEFADCVADQAPSMNARSEPLAVRNGESRGFAPDVEAIARVHVASCMAS